jgi:hypothetical protein
VRCLYVGVCVEYVRLCSRVRECVPALCVSETLPCPCPLLQWIYGIIGVNVGVHLLWKVAPESVMLTFFASSASHLRHHLLFMTTVTSW